MILLHRLTSFALAIVTLLGFGGLIYRPEMTDQFWLAVIWLLVLVPLLLARLLKWEVQRFSFWVFLGTPMFFLVSSLLLFFFLENRYLEIALALVVTGGVWLYAENLFSFYHLPSAYQAYALEYLTWVLFILAGFFFASAAFGAQLVLSAVPTWVIALAVFWAVLITTVGVFWVSKIDQERISLYAFSGAVMLTEIFLVLAMLPTSFVTGAAAFTIALYVYLGLARAHVLEKLSKVVLRRYLIIGSLLLMVIFGTARWI